jgi:hypothetical protein
VCKTWSLLENRTLYKSSKSGVLKEILESKNYKLSEVILNILSQSLRRRQKLQVLEVLRKII